MPTQILSARKRWPEAIQPWTPYWSVTTPPMQKTQRGQSPTRSAYLAYLPLTIPRQLPPAPRPRKSRPIPESVVEIDRDGAKSGSADRRRRIEQSKVRLRFGLLKGEARSCLVRVGAIRQAPRAEQPGVDDLPLVAVASCSKIQKRGSRVL